MDSLTIWCKLHYLQGLLLLNLPLPIKVMKRSKTNRRDTKPKRLLNLKGMMLSNGEGQFIWSDAPSPSDVPLDSGYHTRQQSANDNILWFLLVFEILDGIVVIWIPLFSCTVRERILFLGMPHWFIMRKIMLILLKNSIIYCVLGRLMTIWKKPIKSLDRNVGSYIRFGAMGDNRMLQNSLCFCSSDSQCHSLWIGCSPRFLPI